MIAYIDLNLEKILYIKNRYFKLCLHLHVKKY